MLEGSHLRDRVLGARSRGDDVVLDVGCGRLIASERWNAARTRDLQRRLAGPARRLSRGRGDDPPAIRVGAAETFRDPRPIRRRRHDPLRDHLRRRQAARLRGVLSRVEARRTTLDVRADQQLRRARSRGTFLGIDVRPVSNLARRVNDRYDAMPTKERCSTSTSATSRARARRRFREHGRPARGRGSNEDGSGDRSRRLRAPPAHSA